MIERVKINTYGDSVNANNAMRVEIGDMTLWFSYHTLIAFKMERGKIKVCENCWGSTTGKHLNYIDGGDDKNRIRRDLFEQEVVEILRNYGLMNYV